MDDGWQIPTVAVTVDLVVLTIRDDQLQVLLVERGIEPYAGKLALPGGFLASETEDIDAAAGRELTEETGLRAKHTHLEQVRTYGAPHRDPRRRVITIGYLAILPNLPEPQAGGDARAVRWTPVGQTLRRRNSLAFDHTRVLSDAVERARAKLEYTTLATAFCGPAFTVADLRHVYEIVWGERLDPRNFHRKVTSVENFLVPTGEHTTKDGGRPAALFRRGTAQTLYPPIMRG
ncbi:NUDIX hydrolase [Kibdelosporangium phytohabitans]|uniref:NUDIX hydrolase n=1 Tax=Kibdelosporangium phytohabitans TaxID=860235 RepID=A0A0N9HRS4_9PSEU|nr:NUDIX domain-containing protein [Kibdelosporangium phytohabitans]ALG09891.1 NUDIX hydrolase [Kibdelosporangium phytohabitans]MBE1468706.1 8-oxo-dGTP diphosphatase [Kibdelosporangium phytohabitans]